MWRFQIGAPREERKGSGDKIIRGCKILSSVKPRHFIAGKEEGEEYCCNFVLAKDSFMNCLFTALSTLS